MGQNTFHGHSNNFCGIVWNVFLHDIVEIFTLNLRTDHLKFLVYFKSQKKRMNEPKLLQLKWKIVTSLAHFAADQIAAGRRCNYDDCFSSAAKGANES